MNLFKSFIIVIASYCILTSLVSCEADQETFIESEQQVVPKNIIQKLENAGFSTYDGLYKYEDGYIVEYDIFLTEEDINGLNKKPETSEDEKHYRTNNLVSGTRTIRIYIAPSLGTFARSSLDKAIARYNALNLRLRFQRTTSATANEISIVPVNIPNGFLASAGFPSGGKAFRTIQLNTFYYSDSTRRADTPSVLAHEIGHTIGFRHTDYANRAFSCGNVANPNEGPSGVGAVHIPGTPTGAAVANSWMLACSNGKDRPFIASDRTALNRLYAKPTLPPPPPAVTAQPFYRFFRGGAKANHYYSTNRSGLSGYNFEGVQGKIFTTQASGTIPLYRFYHSSAINHLYKTDRSTPAGYSYQGIAGYLYRSGGSGRIPLYRFFNSAVVDHFYTTNRNEGNSAAGYNYEGVAGYVLR